MPQKKTPAGNVAAAKGLELVLTETGGRLQVPTAPGPVVVEQPESSTALEATAERWAGEALGQWGPELGNAEPPSCLMNGDGQPCG